MTILFQIISQNNFYHLITMKAENSITNKIIPVKSIVESTKYNNKKQASPFSNSEYNNVTLDHFSIPKHLQPYSYMPNQSFSQFQSNTPQQSHHHKEKIKGISVGSKNYTLMRSSQEVGQKNETPQKSYKPFQEYPNSSKKQVYRHGRHESDITKNINFLSEGTIKQVAVDLTPRKIDIVPYDQKLSYRGLINEKKEFFKSVTLNRTDEKDNNYFGQKISTKIEDETWNVSKFQKFMSNQRESQPIYKDQLTKIKTQLFQKEALLFEATQKIEENDRSIKELRCKLEIQIELNRNLKYRLSNYANSKQDSKSNFGLIPQVQKLNAQIMRLKNELNKNKQQKIKQQMDNFASSKLLQLKLRQFQLQEKERTQYIIELKQKEKKIIEGHEKMLNGQQELLRQKEEQLTQISHAAQYYKEQFTKISKVMEQQKDNDKNYQVSKQMVIRELSGEIGDLKESLKNMEFRMRQLIQNQEQFKKQLQSKETETKTLHQEKNTFSGRISQLEQKLSSKVTQLQNNANLKQMEVSMMTKTCEEYKRKLDQYHKYSQQMRLSLLNYNQIQNELKKVLIEKQRQIQVLKNVIEPSDKSRSPQKQMSPIKQGKADDKEYNRLKSINFKLIKENEKLNTIVKDLDFKIYQLYKVNEGLNETILVQLFKNLNEEMKRKFVEVQNQATFL